MSDLVLPYDLRRTIRWSIPMTWASIATRLLVTGHLVLVLIFLAWLEAGKFGAADPVAYGDQIDAIGAKIQSLHLLVYVPTCIANFMWIYRASSNAGRAAPNSARITPGWSIGWYFVPFACLVKPYTAIRETWVTSHNPAAPLNEAGPSLLHKWWAGFIVGSLFSTISARILPDAIEIGELRAGAITGLVGEVLFIWSSVMFVKIQRAVTAAQAELCRTAEALD